MKKPVALFFLFITLLPTLVWASPPVPYSGKVAVNGVNFHGQAKFVFAIRDHSGTVHWRNGVNGQDGINVNVSNGRYVVLLGGQGMNPLPASLFANHDELYVRVAFDNNDGQGLRHLAPDQPITAVPYALSAGHAKVADYVSQKGRVSKMVLIGYNSSTNENQIFVHDSDQNKTELLASLQFPGGGYTDKYLQGQYLRIRAADGSLLTFDIEQKKFLDPVASLSNAVQQEFGSSVQWATPYFPPADSNFSPRELGPEKPLHIVDLNSSVNVMMIWCPPGTFTMGSPTSEPGREAAKEQEHNVTLTKGFYLSKYEVTQAQYEAVMTGNTNGLSPTPSEFPNFPNRPVDQVSWDDVQVFLTRLNAAEQSAGRLPVGWKYVLPTESQWEYACRAGTTTAYFWGNDINSSRANYNWDGGPYDGSDFNLSRDVGQYSANPWGFFDMHGNVWEWTADWYKAANLINNVLIDPTGPASGTYRVERGGSWRTEGDGLRSAQRAGSTPSDRFYDLGFRVGFQKQ